MRNPPSVHSCVRFSGLGYKVEAAGDGCGGRDTGWWRRHGGDIQAVALTGAITVMYIVGRACFPVRCAFAMRAPCYPGTTVFDDSPACSNTNALYSPSFSLLRAIPSRVLSTKKNLPRHRDNIPGRRPTHSPSAMTDNHFPEHRSHFPKLNDVNYHHWSMR